MRNKNQILRWLSWIGLVSIFSVACWFLSQWQFSRQDEVSRQNKIVEQNYDASPVAIDSMLEVKSTWNPELEYRPVKISGHYTTELYLIRNRPYDGNPGFLQLAAFETNDGKYFWIERGWLPTGNFHDYPDAVPSVDTKPRAVIVRLRKTEGIIDRTAPEGQLANINLELASIDLPKESTYTQAYGRLVTETDPLERGVDLGKPELSEGNHLSYALQWLVFALMAIGAVIWNINQDRRRVAGLPPRKIKSLSRDKDAEVEDDLLGN
jgi:cytochrome oxidase assembly protein ShyY1